MSLLLLLPGMDGTGELFAPLCEYLPATVVSYPRERALGYAELRAEVPLPEEPCVLVAESFSGPLAIRIAALEPARVRALVLVATFARGPVLARWFAGVMPAALFARKPPDTLLRSFLIGDASDAEVASLRTAIGSVAPGVLAHRLRAIARADEREALRSTTVPLLYLGGRQDRLVGSAERTEILRARPDATIELLDAPHLVLQRQPEAAARIIASWLQRTGQAP